MSRNSFTWRAFISTALTLSFFVMMLSGLVLFVSPPGRVANWSGWQMLGLTKRAWQNQHIVFGFAFMILSIFHLFVINWKAFLSYLIAKASRGLSHPTEIITAITLFVVLATGTLFHVAPFEQLIVLGERLSGSWETARSSSPPVPHAETLTLEELGGLPQVASTGAELVKKFQAAGVKVRDSRQTLQQIASDNGMEVQRLYRLIVTERSSARFSEKTGWANKTLREAADSAGVTPLALQQALKQQGIEATPDELLRDIAQRHGIRASGLLRKIETITEKR
ncbi:MAG: DUF4405 domain-containing protein [Chlorobiaceae bacterium]|nr:DUF4405 domain-containing protein [Chlorobiaceae bacterium]